MNWQLLTDATFWSTIIAGVALVLSQLPPIRELLRGTSVRIHIPEQLFISHFLGNLHLNTFIDIRNSGAHTVTITKIEFILNDDDGKVWRMPARTYYPRESLMQSGSNPIQLLIGSIVLKPSETWQETVRCYRYWTESEEEKANQIISAIQNSISQKLPKPTLDNPQPVVVEPFEADIEAVKSSLEFFERNFNLHKGNYHLYVAVLSDNDRLISVERYRLTFFESHIVLLKSLAEDYKFGAGVYLPPNSAKQTWIRLKPEGNSRQVKQSYLALPK